MNECIDKLQIAMNAQVQQPKRKGFGSSSDDLPITLTKAQVWSMMVALQEAIDEIDKFK